MSRESRHVAKPQSTERRVHGSTTPKMVVRLLVAIGVMTTALVVAPYTVDAAIISVEGCVVDGSVVSVAVDDDTLDAYDGGWYTLHNAYGNPIDHNVPLATFNEVPPVCVVPVSGGVPDATQATWAWCLEVYDDVCVEEPWGDRVPNVIDERQLALVAWRIGEWTTSGVTTGDSRIQTQMNIWCVTDSYQHPSLTSWGSAPGTVTNCNEYNDWLDATILPTLVTGADRLNVTAPTGTTTVDDLVIIGVDTTLAEVELDISGADSFDVCAGETNATLLGTTLTIVSPGSPVELCATRGAEGDVTVSVLPTAQHLVPAHTIGFTLDDCQVMATHTLPSTALHRDLVISFVADALDSDSTTTSTTSTTISTITTTTVLDVASAPTNNAAGADNVDKKLAVGGTEAAPVAGTAIGLLVIGVAMVAVRRRRLYS